MVNPLLVAGSTLGAVYSVGKAVDNIRYWHDYQNTTGKVPKYPFRSGAMDWMYSGSHFGGSMGKTFSYGKLKKV